MSEAVTISLKRLREQNQKLEQDLNLAVSALELACELLPVPEHRQDDVWYYKEKQVYETLAKITGKAE